MGNLYAPRATVLNAGIQDLYGAVFAGDFVGAGITNIHYDRAVVRDGDECTPKDEPPDECQDCSGCAATAACNDGRCGPCQTDDDCCQPLTCSQGDYVPLLFI